MKSVEYMPFDEVFDVGSVESWANEKWGTTRVTGNAFGTIGVDFTLHLNSKWRLVMHCFNFTVHC